MGNFDDLFLETDVFGKGEQSLSDLHTELVSLYGEVYDARSRLDDVTERVQELVNAFEMLRSSILSDEEIKQKYRPQAEELIKKTAEADAKKKLWVLERGKRENALEIIVGLMDIIDEKNEEIKELQKKLDIW